MNDAVMDLLMDRMDSRRGRRDRERDRMRDREDSRRGVRGSGRPDRADYLEDERRGVRGSGRRDSRDYEDYEDGRDYEDARRDYGNERRSELRLTKTDLKDWKHMLENADGTRGPHYDMQQIMTVADKIGVHFSGFTEPELCMAVNMIYSDHCKSIKKYVQSDKMLEFCVEQAVEFLDDIDGPEPFEKLMLYYHCIVNA